MPVGDVRTSIEYMCVHMYVFCVHVWCGVCVCMWRVCTGVMCGCVHAEAQVHTPSAHSHTLPALPAEQAVSFPQGGQ